MWEPGSLHHVLGFLQVPLAAVVTHDGHRVKMLLGVEIRSGAALAGRPFMVDFEAWPKSARCCPGSSFRRGLFFAAPRIVGRDECHAKWPNRDWAMSDAKLSLSVCVCVCAGDS